MPITDDLELPIEFVKITGPGVDALDNRKETGSPVCLEGEINKRLRAYIGSAQAKRNHAGLRKLAEYAASSAKPL